MTESDEAPWLIFDAAGGGTTAAPIIKEYEAVWVVSVDGEELHVTKDRSRQRTAMPASLDLLSVRSPMTLLSQFEDDPLDVVVRALHEWRGRFTKEQITERLSRLDLPIASAWKKLQPKLAKHPNIHREGTPLSYCWVEAAATQVTVKELLHALHDPRRAPKDETALKHQLGELAASANLSLSERMLAGAIVSGIPRPSWNDLAADDMDPDLAQHLLALAAQEKAWDFLGSVALKPSATSRSAAAAEALATADDQEVCGVLSREIERLVASVEKTTDLSGSLKRVEARLPLLRRSFPEHPNTQLIGALLKLCLAIPRSSEAEVAVTVRQWCLRTPAEVVNDRAELVRALRQVNAPPRALIAAVSTLSARSFRECPARADWLGALQRWEPARAHLQDSAELWAGVALDDLALLDSDPDIGPLIASPLAQKLILGRAVERSLEVSAANLAHVLALPDRQLDLVSEQLLQRAAGRIEPDTALGRAIAAIQQSATDRLTQEHEAEREVLTNAQQAALQQLQQRVSEQEEVTRAAELRRDRLAAEVDQLKAHSSDSSEAQLRQAQMDSLRAMADLLYEAIKAVPGVASGSVSAAEVSDRLRRLASAANVTLHAMPGDQIDLDLALYRRLDDDTSGSAQVRVVDPAITTTTPSGVTLLRYGSVVADT